MNPTLPQTSTETHETGVLRRVASNLYRMEPYGTYYALAKRGGKQFRHSLKTTDRKLAERRLREIMGKVERLKTDAGRVTFGELAEQFTNTVLAARDLKPQSREDCLIRITMIQRTWRGLAQTAVRDIKSADCEAWFAQPRQQVHAQRLNNELGILKQIFDFAEREGVIMSNPAEPIGRVKIVTSEPIIPTREQFTRLVVTLRELENHEAAGLRCSPQPYLTTTGRWSADDGSGSTTTWLRLPKDCSTTSCPTATLAPSRS